MRWLANENIPGVAVGALRSAGFDVAWMRDLAPGADDEEVLAIARDQQRLVLTFDKDFGFLAFTRGPSGVPGVVLLRIDRHRPDRLAARLVEILSGRDDWHDRFAVVDEERVRLRRMPR